MTNMLAVVMRDIDLNLASNDFAPCANEPNNLCTFVSSPLIAST